MIYSKRRQQQYRGCDRTEGTRASEFEDQFDFVRTHFFTGAFEAEFAVEALRASLAQIAAGPQFAGPGAGAHVVDHLLQRLSGVPLALVEAGDHEADEDVDRPLVVVGEEDEADQSFPSVDGAQPGERVVVRLGKGDGVVGDEVALLLSEGFAETADVEHGFVGDLAQRDLEFPGSFGPCHLDDPSKYRFAFRGTSSACLNALSEKGQELLFHSQYAAEFPRVRTARQPDALAAARPAELGAALDEVRADSLPAVFRLHPQHVHQEKGVSCAQGEDFRSAGKADERTVYFGYEDDVVGKADHGGEEACPQVAIDVLSCELARHFGYLDNF